MPIEPTESMVVNGFESWPAEFFSDPEVWDAFEKMTGCQQAAHKARLCYAAMLACAPQPPAPTPFQQRVQPWMLACFGAVISADKLERNHRFFEEAGELVQACGMTREEAHALVDYTWSRPVGEPKQEVGGVMVTLAALCLANGLDMHAAGETELARVWTMVEQIRAKQATKPKHSPLPGPSEPRTSYAWRDTGPLESGDER